MDEKRIIKLTASYLKLVRKDLDLLEQRANYPHDTYLHQVGDPNYLLARKRIQYEGYIAKESVISNELGEIFDEANPTEAEWNAVIDKTESGDFFHFHNMI